MVDVAWRNFTLTVAEEGSMNPVPNVSAAPGQTVNVIVTGQKFSTHASWAVYIIDPATGAIYSNYKSIGGYPGPYSVSMPITVAPETPPGTAITLRAIQYF